jgi:glycosyltransferase involved in cell wall biosynthesis
MKKKILFVRPTLGFGGADRVTLNLLKGFDRDHFACDLALMRAEGDFLNDVPKDVNIYNGNVSSLWSFWKPLSKIIKNSEYDVVYSTCGGAAIPLMIAVKISKFKGISVVSERGALSRAGVNSAKRKFMLFLKKYLYKHADWVTTVSKGVAEECHIKLKVSNEKLRVVNNPIINSDLEEQKKEEVTHSFFTSNRPMVLAVGRFVHEKDYHTLIRAFKLVRQNMNAGLFILGKGPLEEQIKEMVEKENLSKDVCFAGFDKNPFKYMYNTDVFVLSSRNEGMPGVLVQAMACEAACVSTDCPTGPNELIVDGESGFLVPVEDYKTMAEKIEVILANQELKKSFKAKARERVNKYEEAAGVDSYFNFL